MRLQVGPGPVVSALESDWPSVRRGTVLDIDVFAHRDGEWQGIYQHAALVALPANDGRKVALGWNTPIFDHMGIGVTTERTVQAVLEERWRFHYGQHTLGLDSRQRARLPALHLVRRRQRARTLTAAALRHPLPREPGMTPVHWSM